MCNGTHRKKETCSKQYAVCVQLEIDFPDFSSLYEETCVSVEESIDDIYEILGNTLSELDLADLDDGCIEYVKIGGKITTKNALVAQQEAICDLQNTVASMQDQITTMQEQIITLQTNCE